MVYKVKVPFDIKSEGGGYFTFIPGSLDVRDKGYDCVIGGAIGASTKLVGGTRFNSPARKVRRLATMRSSILARHSKRVISLYALGLE